MDTTIMIVSYLGLAAVAFYAGYIFSGWITKTAMKELMQEAGISDEEIKDYLESMLKGKLEPAETAPQGVRIRLEKINGNLMCYKKDTGQFLGQAATKEELTDILTQRLGPILLLVEPEDGAEYLQEGASQ